MATDIFDRGFSDHVVFDRIVDVDRTITLARQAADEAEKRGQSDKAAKLREKADYLEEILNNTQNPDYSDEEEGTPPEQSNGGEGTGKGKASGQGEKSDTGDNDAEEGEEEKDSKESDAAGNGSGEEEKDEDEGEGSGSGGGGEEKQPEDIANLDQSNGKHASGTNQHQGGGPSSNGQGGGGGSQGSGTNNPQNQGQGQGKGQGQNQELDPFRVSSSRQPGNQKQPTKEEILAAIIKKLSSLSGEAKKGADRALQDYFNNVSGGGTL